MPYQKPGFNCSSCQAHHEFTPAQMSVMRTMELVHQCGKCGADHGLSRAKDYNVQVRILSVRKQMELIELDGKAVEVATHVCEALAVPLLPVLPTIGEIEQRGAALLSLPTLPTIPPHIESAGSFLGASFDVLVPPPLPTLQRDPDETAPVATVTPHAPLHPSMLTNWYDFTRFYPAHDGWYHCKLHNGQESPTNLWFCRATESFFEDESMQMRIANVAITHFRGMVQKCG